jgi:transcription elongation factor/antiterminator RfaH
MIQHNLCSELKWYALNTHPKQEERAEANLRAWNVETFSPMTSESRTNPFGGKAPMIVKPLFPNYIFARFNTSGMLHKICFTRGVRSVVSFGHEPAVVDEEIIAFIKSQVQADGLIKIGEPLRTGDRVVIKDGPLKHLSGIFQSHIKGTARVMILLTAVNYQGRAVIDQAQVRKAG